MQNLEFPKNQYSLAIWLLIKNTSQGVTMKQCCELLFYKFQTRLGDIERSLDSNGRPRSLKLKIRRLKMNKKNRFGYSMTFLNYKSLASYNYLCNLVKYLNKNGLK